MTLHPSGAPVSKVPASGPSACAAAATASWSAPCSHQPKLRQPPSPSEPLRRRTACLCRRSRHERRLPVNLASGWNVPHCSQKWRAIEVVFGTTGWTVPPERRGKQGTRAFSRRWGGWGVWGGGRGGV